MEKFTKNAPHLKKAWNKNAFELLILAGSRAWEAWNKGKGIEWQNIADALQIEPFNTQGGAIPRYDQKPVILGNNQLAEIDQLCIASPDQRYIKIIQCGELSQQEITALCLNLATTTKAEIVELVDSATLTLNENLSDYIQRLREQGTETAEMIAQVAQSEEITVKDKSATSEKSRAFKQWLGLDLALQRGSREIYAYNGTIWQQLDDETLEEKAVEFFEANQLLYSDVSVLRLINTLKMQLPKMTEPSPTLIYFRNGTLNRSTLLFEPIKREDFVTSHLNCDYTDQPQNTPHFNQWMDFVANGNEQKKTNILAALYAVLTNRYDWQLFLEITGDGGSGKSVFAKIATMLVGNNSTTQGRLEDMDEPRGRENFINKNLIISSEQSRYGGDGAGLKSITGGDPVNIDPKYRKPFDAVIQAIVMIVNNEATRFTERCGGIDRRRVIYHFDRVVPDEQRDPHLLAKIEQEISGIVYQLMQRFKDPMDAKRALHNQQTSAEALEVKSQTDHITEFCGYFLTSDKCDGLFIGNARMFGKERTHLYPAYLAFTGTSGIKELNLNNFAISLRQGIKQQRNEFDYNKQKTKAGVRTNIHFKDVDEFIKTFLK
ncbi:DNA primase family protein [Avibacterium paragallinarum]|uniref:DNA primase family protein n=1 Tax=Avibacterium paragallinarum TaxID=728 RepID=UPI000614F368|nr:phage/plasmid primase, P4 family [Avibacterium paragallinarum]KAA6209817.1 DNA primase [Avibacterium paragallinarum]KKB01899.1 DNA primase [Avibacterium paragallinarum]RZN73300.1 DNA primase [Avibacterium paragallinarum]